jgi:hypothetical protein
MKLWQTIRTLLPQAIRSWTRSAPLESPVTRLEFPRTEITRILRTRGAVAAKGEAETRAGQRGSRSFISLLFNHRLAGDMLQLVLPPRFWHSFYPF